MANSSDISKSQDRTNKLLRDLIIVQLSVAGVGQLEIRSIVGGSIADVNRIAKAIRKANKSKSNV